MLEIKYQVDFSIQLTTPWPSFPLEHHTTAKERADPAFQQGIKSLIQKCIKSGRDLPFYVVVHLELCVVLGSIRSFFSRLWWPQAALAGQCALAGLGPQASV